MARQRRDYLQRVHDALVWWAEWHHTHIEMSAIGYPSMTLERRMMDGRLCSGGAVACSIAPEVLMPRSIARVDRAVREMPAELAGAVRRNYLEGEAVPRHALDAALHWLAGRMNRPLQMSQNFVHSTLISGVVRREEEAEPAAAR